MVIGTALNAAFVELVQCRRTQRIRWIGQDLLTLQDRDAFKNQINTGHDFFEMGILSTLTDFSVKLPKRSAGRKYSGDRRWFNGQRHRLAAGPAR